MYKGYFQSKTVPHFLGTFTMFSGDCIMEEIGEHVNPFPHNTF